MKIEKKKSKNETGVRIRLEKRIPTLVGVILVMVMVAILVFLGQTRIFRSGAAKLISPQDVRITNVTPDSFTVSWLTEEATMGMVDLIDSQGVVRFSDFRTKTTDLAASEAHYVIVDGLTSSKEYQFVVFSGGSKFYQANSKPYRVKTAASIFGGLPSANLASGIVQNPAGEPADGAIVYLDIVGIAPLSSLVTNQGNWVVSLAKAFSADLSKLADYQEGSMLEEILASGGKEGIATALVYTKDDDPVPLIVLGNQYDFTQAETASSLPTPTLLSQGESGSRLGRVETGFTGNVEFQIISPDDGEMVSHPRPEILGLGPKGDKVVIILESAAVYEADLKVDNSGKWSWFPPQDLEPGNHILTVKHVDPSSGKEEVFTRTFVLAASIDDNPSFSATPSGATVTPTLVVTATPTSVPSPTSTPTPTLGLTPTSVLSPTLSPTATPIPTLTIEPTQAATISGGPTTGFFGLTLMILIASAVLFLVVLTQRI